MDADELAQLLEKEKRHSAVLQEEVNRLRKALEIMSTTTEAEEEMITNKLMRRVQELRKEKEQLLNEVEREEEKIANIMTKKLRQLKQEKIDLENQLEQEQEAIVNRFSRRLSESEEAKQAIMVEIDREEENLTNKLQKRLKDANKLNEMLEHELDFRQSFVIKRLQEGLNKLADEKLQLENQLAKQNDSQVRELLESLQGPGVELNAEDGAAIADYVKKLGLEQQRQLQASEELIKEIRQLGIARRSDAIPSPKSSFFKRGRCLSQGSAQSMTKSGSALSSYGNSVIFRAQRNGPNLSAGFPPNSPPEQRHLPAAS